MAIGVSRVLKSKWPHTRVIVLEPASAPVITKGRPGTHHVEGVGIGFILPLLNGDLYPRHAVFRKRRGGS